MTKKLFIVDAISTFRNRYVVEAESIEHAYDEVTMVESGAEKDYFEPATQKYLGETIIDGREISINEFNKIILPENMDLHESSSYWMEEKLIRKIDYGERNTRT